MTVKNIAFSGFMAAILMSATGAAFADPANPIKLASQGYVDAQVGTRQETLTAANQGYGVLITEEDGVQKIGVDVTEIATNESVLTEISNSLNEDGTITSAVQTEIQKQIEEGGIGDAIDTSIDTALGATVDGQPVELTTDNKTVYGAINEIDANADAAKSAADAAQAAADKAQGEVDALEGVVANKADASALDALATKTYVEEQDNALSGRIKTLEDADYFTQAQADGLYAAKEATATAIQEAKDAASAADGKAVAAQNDVDALELVVNAEGTGLAAVKTIADGAASAAAAADDKAVAAQDDVDALELVVNAEGTGLAAVKTIADNAAGAAQTAQGEVDALEQVVADNAKAVTDANYISGNDIASGSYLMLSDGAGGISWSSIVVVDKDGNNITMPKDAPSAQ